MTLSGATSTSVKQLFFIMEQYPKPNSHSWKMHVSIKSGFFLRFISRQGIISKYLCPRRCLRIFKF